MPQIIQHIDAIARQKQRDVLLIVCGKQAVMNIMQEYSDGDVSDGEYFFALSNDWKTSGNRPKVIDWLNANDVKWQPCAGIADVLVIEDGYAGAVYVDLPYDTTLPKYKKLEAFLEHSDGSRVFPDVLFCCLTLRLAMENTEHDEPGFWERWARNF